MAYYCFRQTTKFHGSILTAPDPGAGADAARAADDNAGAKDFATMLFDPGTGVGVTRFKDVTGDLSTIF